MAIDTQHGPANGPNTTHQSVVTGNQGSILTDKATYTLKTTPGYVHQLLIGAVGTTWTIDFYDDLTGVNRKFFSWVTADGKGPFTIQFPCSAGITIISGGTTAGQASIVWS